MAATLIELHGFVRRFANFQVGPLDLRVDAGERVALIGPNGAGKTTTMRALAGRMSTFKGRIVVDGHSLDADRALARARVGALEDQLLGLNWMRVREHLDFVSAFHPNWDPDRAEALRRQFELPEHRRLAELSRGMKVKLGLIVAEAPRPPVLLLDEPTTGIDPVMRTELLSCLSDWCPRGGTRALVFSTHLLEDVPAIAERLILLRSGLIIFDGTADQITEGAPEMTLLQGIEQRLQGSDSGLHPAESGVHAVESGMHGK
jgi:ABC-2 type transport system ATP-binding protein